MTISSSAAAATMYTNTTDVRPPQADGWSTVQRVVFRFVFSYLVLSLVPFPIGNFPGSLLKTDSYDRVWLAIASWVGTHVLHVTPNPPSFSAVLSDSVAGYVTLLCFVVVAALATIVWTLLDRTRREYRTLHEWLRLYVRYALACNMLAYGMDKIFVLQFSWSLPGPMRLAQPLGNYSPFALLWTFMGYSTWYTIFAGTGEVIGAVLLFFRRTTTLGALILCGVMANVVALNFAYQIPVKLFSSTLLLLAMFLVAPDATRLFDLLVLNRPTAPLGNESRFRWQWMAKPRLAYGVAISILALVWFAGPAQAPPRARAKAPKSPLYGLYQVESFAQQGTPIAPSDSNWRRVILESPRGMIILTTDDQVRSYGTAYDTTKKTITLSDDDDSDAVGGNHATPNVLTYTRPDSTHLELRGDLASQPVVIVMRKVDLAKSTLLSRGFHWVENGGYYR